MADSHEKNNWPVWATESIEIRDYDPSWKEKGQAVIKELYTLLSPFGATQVEHIGSTSITGLPAKPIIDVMAEIYTFEKIEEIAALLTSSDWHYVPPELDNRPWRRFFVKVKNDKRVAHLHLIRAGEERWHKQLLFRDRLRENPFLLEEYKNLKYKLVEQFANDREVYTEAKSAFIERVLEQ
jgi:GrpB-like predicted nucleotidyltransferase (UPF0157 family)